MCKHELAARLERAAVLVISSLAAVAVPVQGQLSLIAVTPADGATSVSSPATIVLEFSTPLDTTAEFEVSGGFYLGLEIFPKDSTSEPEEVTISADLKTVTARGLLLKPDTKFALFLSGAKSANGGRLDRPYAVTFTTGSSLSSAAVSGNVNFGFGDPGGTGIGLFRSLPFGDENDEPVALAVVPLGAGDYVMNYVPPGTYLVLAFKDINGDGNIDPGEDAFGGHNGDGDGIADAITIAEGANLSGIDVRLSPPQAVTARQSFAITQTIAQRQFGDTVLSALIGNGLSPHGSTAGWYYIFYSANQDSIFGVTKFGSMFFIMPDVFSDEEDPDLTVALPDDWIDSDVAADSAEYYGGSEFRQTYPDAESNAALLNAPLGSSFSHSGANASTAPPNKSRHSGLPAMTKCNRTRFAISASADSAVWFFSYYSAMADEFINVVLDARTAEIATQVDDRAAMDDRPRYFALSQNYPNPFNPSTTIEFALPKAGFVALRIYNTLGEEVATLVAEKLPAGSHRRVWDASGLASGIYVYRIEAGGFAQAKQLILLK